MSTLRTKVFQECCNGFFYPGKCEVFSTSKSSLISIVESQLRLS